MRVKRRAVRRKSPVKKIATAMKRTAGAPGTTQAAGYCFHFARSFAPSSSRRTSELVNPRSIKVSSNA